jgi:hypothetical protein
VGSGAPRAAARFTFIRFTSILLTVARGVTDPSVGSGALLGGSNLRRSGDKVQTASGETKIREQWDARPRQGVLDNTRPKRLSCALRSASPNTSGELRQRALNLRGSCATLALCLLVKLRIV